MCLIAATGIDEIGPVGGGGTGGGVVGIAPASLDGGGGGGGGAAAAACFGAAAGAAPTSPTAILANFAPGLTVDPSSTRSSSITPDTGDGTGTDVLSVSISQITSSTEILSPLPFSHLKSPSVIDSANAGQVMTCSSSNVKLVRNPRVVISTIRIGWL